MPLQFSWEELWNYHDALADSSLKAHLEQEIIGEDWLFRQSARAQEQILKDAPKEFVETIATRIKAEVAVKLGLNPFQRR